MGTDKYVPSSRLPTLRRVAPTTGRISWRCENGLVGGRGGPKRPPNFGQSCPVLFASVIYGQYTPWVPTSTFLPSSHSGSELPTRSYPHFTREFVEKKLASTQDEIFFQCNFYTVAGVP